MGKRMWIGYGKIKIEREWWFCNEGRVVLKDGGGNRNGIQRQGKREEGRTRGEDKG